MNKYQDLSVEIQKIKTPIEIMIGVGIILNLLIVGISMWIQFGGEDLIRYSSMEACMKGMESIISNNPDPELISKNVLDDIQKNKITFSVDRIHLVKYVDGLGCDVITKEPGGYGSYLITLEKNSRFKYFFKIRDVKGQPIISEYQR